jgi:hypothetical protein
MTKGMKLLSQHIPWNVNLLLSLFCTQSPFSRLAVPIQGHPSVSLPPLSSPTLPLFICTPSPHLCTISRDYTQSRRLPDRRPDDFLDADSLEVDDFRPPSSLRPERHRTSCGRIRTGLRDTMALSTITWTPILGGLVLGSLVL